jgi:hypothetical protein
MVYLCIKPTQMLKSENFPDQHLLRLDYSCQSLNTLYHRSFSILQQYLQPSQLVVISLDQVCLWIYVLFFYVHICIWMCVWMDGWIDVCINVYGCMY